MALYNAADEDVGTGGPDFVRGIYPTAKIVSAAGLSDVPEDRVLAMYEALIAERRRS